MGYKQALEMLNLMDLVQDIQFHLQYNLDSPAPGEMIPIAVKAIMHCREGNFNENLLIPFKDRIGWMVPAYIVVETYDLEPWVNELDSDGD